MSASPPTSTPATSTPAPKGSAESPPWAIHSLPPFPAVALQLMGLLDDDEAPIKGIVTLLRADPALSAEILRVSNSVLYGLSRRIDNISHAVVLIGAESVKRLALTVSLGRYSKRFVNDQGLRACWDHSVACALISERLAQHMNAPRDRAYTAGLLLDVGRLALLAGHPAKYAKMLEAAHEDGFDQLEHERRVFDIDHCAAGEWLARHWNLPHDLVEAIATHHTHQPNDDSTASIAAAADRVADALGFAALPLPPKVGIEEAIASLPVLDQAAATVALSSMDSSIRETIGAFSAG